jgi:uncharacterized protein (TIGR02001 family)
MRGLSMKTFVLSVVATAALATPALAADIADQPVKAPPAPAAAAPPFDVAFGAAVMNDYIFRGITQSNHKPSVAAYFEPRYNINGNLQLYAGMAGESINFPNTAAAEIDIYGGIRPTFGPVALDFGVWYYLYPGGTCYGAVGCQVGSPSQFIKSDLSFWELYAKATWTPIEPLALGVSFYYTPSFLNSGADGEYLSGTAKYTGPAFANGVGWYLSGELAYQWLGTTDSFYGIPAGVRIAHDGFTTGAFANGIPLPDYLTWNVGLGLTWKVFTLDLRYSDTNLSKSDCYAFTGDYTASLGGAGSAINPAGFRSKWCGATFIAKLSADLTLANLK